jgi:hypothetical protein
VAGSQLLHFLFPLRAQGAFRGLYALAAPLNAVQRADRSVMLIFVQILSELSLHQPKTQRIL